MPFRNLPALFVCLLCALSGCSSRPSTHLSPSTRPLLCYVGINMQASVDQAARVFEFRTGILIKTEVNDPRPLIDRIEVSDAADLFVCHDPFLPMLIEHGVPVRQAWTAASLVPTIAVAKGNPKGIHGLKDLARPGVRVGLTDQTSMSGNIVSVMTRRAGIETDFKRNVTKEFPAGRELAKSIMRDEIDAGIIWNVVIHIFQDKLDGVPVEAAYRPVPGIDATGYNPALGNLELDYVRVTVALLGTSKRSDDARRFAEFLSGPEGRAIFLANGFAPPDDTRPALLPRTPHSTTRPAAH